MAKYYSSMIQKGSTGDDVKKWQQYLQSYGYELDDDGIFGDATWNATEDFQINNGLKNDGIVGEETWGKAGFTYQGGTTSLNGGTTSSSPSTSSPSSSGDWSYDNFTYEDYEAPDKFEYDDFTHKEYEESDSVKDAQNALNTHNATKPVEYQSQWKTQLDALMNSIMNREKFSYNFNEDPLYQQYREKYIQQGKMMMGDAIGQASAMTGGYGNSFAQSVGQQAYQQSLDNLNDIVPELYAMSLDKYIMEGQDLYNQYGLIADREDQDYGRYRDSLADFYTERDYLQGRYDSERELDYSKYVDDRNFEYGKYSDDRNLAYSQYESDRNFDYNQYVNDRNLAYDKYATDKNLSYQEYRDKIEDEKWQKQYDESVRQYNETKGGSGSSGGGTYADTLWTATGTTDDKGNPIFRNSEGKTQAFGAGVNPYTGTKHKDAKYGTFSNGYQPNNIGGTKLKNSGMSTSVTGKNQTIWEANGKYWLWRGELNKYVEVDISDLD